MDKQAFASLLDTEPRHSDDEHHKDASDSEHEKAAETEHKGSAETEHKDSAAQEGDAVKEGSSVKPEVKEGSGEKDPIEPLPTDDYHTLKKIVTGEEKTLDATRQAAVDWGVHMLTNFHQGEWERRLPLGEYQHHRSAKLGFETEWLKEQHEGGKKEKKQHEEESPEEKKEQSREETKD